jgi:hypothetical protein
MYRIHRVAGLPALRCDCLGVYVCWQKSLGFTSWTVSYFLNSAFDEALEHHSDCRASSARIQQYLVLGLVITSCFICSNVMLLKWCTFNWRCADLGFGSESLSCIALHYMFNDRAGVALYLCCMLSIFEDLMCIAMHSRPSKSYHQCWPLTSRLVEIINDCCVFGSSGW